MDEDTAKKLAKEYLVEQIQLTLHEELPPGVNLGIIMILALIMDH